tara:strand:+ start:40 stop:762 length:723 start_codon:yes stop_codon:yes gene_type:complete
MAYSRYFTKVVKPRCTISVLDGGAYAADDVLFPSTAFEVPKGTNRLMGVTAVVRGNDGTAQALPMDLIFSSNALSLGTEGATATLAPSNDLLGVVNIAAADYGQNSLDNFSIATAHATPPHLCLTSDDGNISSFNRKDGFDRIYVGGLSGGSFNFASQTAVTAQHLAGASTVITLDGRSALLTLAAGDVIRADDNAVIGTIKTVDSATQITLEEPNVEQIEDGDEIYTTSPIKLIFSFER